MDGFCRAVRTATVADAGLLADLLSVVGGQEFVLGEDLQHDLLMARAASA